MLRVFTSQVWPPLDPLSNERSTKRTWTPMGILSQTFFPLRHARTWFFQGPGDMSAGVRMRLDKDMGAFFPLTFKLGIQRGCLGHGHRFVHPTALETLGLEELLARRKMLCTSSDDGMLSTHSTEAGTQARSGTHLPTPLALTCQSLTCCNSSFFRHRVAGQTLIA